MESLPNPNSSCGPPPPDPALMHSNSWWHSLMKNRDRRGSAGFSENMGDGINLPNRIDDDEGSGINLGRSMERGGISIAKNMSQNELQKYAKGSPGSLKKKSGQLFLEVERSPQGIQSGDIYDLMDRSSTGVMKNTSKFNNIDHHFTPSPIGKQEIRVVNEDKIVSQKNDQHMTYAGGEAEGLFTSTDKKLLSSITEADIPIVKDKSSMRVPDSKLNTIIEAVGTKKLLQDNDSDNITNSTIVQKYMAKVPDSSSNPTTSANTHNFLGKDPDSERVKHSAKAIVPATTKKHIVEDPDSDYTILPAITKKPMVEDSGCTILPAITKKSEVKDADADSHMPPKINLTSSSTSEETTAKKSSFISRKLSSFLQSSLANNWFFKRETSEEESDIESTKSDDFSRSESEVSGSSSPSTPTSPTSSHDAPEGIVLLRRNSKWNAVRDALYNHPEKLREMNTWQPQH